MLLPHILRGHSVLLPTEWTWEGDRSVNTKASAAGISILKQNWSRIGRMWLKKEGKHLRDTYFRYHQAAWTLQKMPLPLRWASQPPLREM